MLDNISSTSESLYKRQVSPAAEGHLRSESRQEAEARQTDRVKDRFANRAEQQDVAHARQERRLEASELSRRRSEHLNKDFNPAPSQAAEMAEKLAKQIKESRQEEVRQQRYSRYAPANRSRQVNQAYLTNLPVQPNRIIDEMA